MDPSYQITRDARRIGATSAWIIASSIAALALLAVQPVEAAPLPDVPCLAPSTAVAEPWVNRAWDFLRQHAPELTNGARVVVTLSADETFLAWTSPAEPDVVYLNVGRVASRSELQIIGYLAHELEHRRLLKRETLAGGFWRVWQNRNRRYEDRSHEATARAVGDRYVSRAVDHHQLAIERKWFK